MMQRKGGGKGDDRDGKPAKAWVKRPGEDRRRLEQSGGFGWSLQKICFQIKKGQVRTFVDFSYIL